uniref:Uncharacterized protein n=1 Tax=Arundo donax TaxID=35708 RepID=A0A0A9GD49_ARUDO
MCKYLIGEAYWLAPLRPRLPFGCRVELFQLRAICASLSSPTSKGLISSNSARTLSSASSDMGPFGENDTLQALERFFILGIRLFNVLSRRYQSSNFLKLCLKLPLKDCSTDPQTLFWITGSQPWHLPSVRERNEAKYSK